MLRAPNLKSGCAGKPGRRHCDVRRKARDGSPGFTFKAPGGCVRLPAGRPVPRPCASAEPGRGSRCGSSAVGQPGASASSRSSEAEGRPTPDCHRAGAGGRGRGASGEPRNGQGASRSRGRSLLSGADPIPGDPSLHAGQPTDSGGRDRFSAGFRRQRSDVLPPRFRRRHRAAEAHGSGRAQCPQGLGGLR